MEVKALISYRETKKRSKEERKSKRKNVKSMEMIMLCTCSLQGSAIHSFITLINKKFMLKWRWDGEEEH